ncbi:hypothetical protein CbuK_1327 [Coxiella burnetii CbuK_Q154]|uniref:Uncharacterized protein n=1 Tax=Coxiella burnetii (strain Dugway 5J108-111) TaxID=434922 RepID=B5XHG1_COXBN|nr:hypothetical protein CBUD_1551a [Coxiella burnetii Dugway 5J108-111]ACJ18780.1 hypothetical protein CbuG_1484 [Coxiella burnetii CbuG_Q212]ACJ20504.1 hypothetical protein CbuK_1327 [Coxiella burnetii CbuK_Q154]
MKNIEKVNIKDKLNLFHEYWTPKIVGGSRSVIK